MVEVLILWQVFVEQTHTPRKPQRKGAKSLYLFLVSLAVHLKSLASIGEDEKTEAKKTKKQKHIQLLHHYLCTNRSSEMVYHFILCMEYFQPGLPNFHRNRLLNMIPLQFLTFVNTKQFIQRVMKKQLLIDILFQSQKGSWSTQYGVQMPHIAANARPQYLKR